MSKLVRGPLKQRGGDAMEPSDPMERQCTATSKQSGQRCRRFAIPGGRVCVMHGGKAPQVQQAAKERLAALIDPAIDRLGQLVHQTDFPSTAYQAVRDVLDRNGFKPKEQVEEAIVLTVRWQTNE